jgi:methyl-accepting chemotaxis protein
MKWSIGTRIGAGFTLALVALVIIGVAAYRSTTSLLVANDWKSHTFVVLRSLAGLLSAMQDAEDGQRGYLITGRDSYLEPYLAGAKAAGQAADELRKLTADNPNQQRRLDAIQPAIANRLDVLRQTIDLRRGKGFEAASAVVATDRGKQAMDEIRRLVAAMDDEETNLLRQRDQRVSADAARTISILVYGIPVAVVLVGIVGFLITRNISNPMRQITALAARIASGDLSGKPQNVHRSDEVGVLARTFAEMTGSLQVMANMAKQIAAGDLSVKPAPQSQSDVLGNAFATMVENLREVTRQLRDGASVLGSSAAEIVSTVAQAASGSAETAAAVSQTSTTVEEVKQTAQMSSEKARSVSDSAQKTAQISQNGRKSVEESIEAMHRIQEQMESIAESIVQLSEQGQAIAEIIATVNDLAEQSNLLAVNAAIEAAKAGDQGKGFAVVAQEVKSLAGQSKQATAQVRSILGEVQKATSAAVMVTEQGSKAVESGVKLSTQAREAIGALTASIEEAARAAAQIAASAQQQLAGMDQVAMAMQSIKEASVQNMAGTKQSEDAAQKLQELGFRLKGLVEHYRV